MKLLQVLFISLLAILAPIQAMAIAAVSLCVLDLPLGIIAAKKRGEKITSAGLKRTIVKVFVYEMALILGLIVQKYMLSDTIPLINLISTLIGCTELKSALENLEDISGQPFLKQLIDLLNKKQDSISDQ